jgi:hypothetical protein
MFVIGNVVSRARLADGTPKYPLMEAILDAGAPYTSGPQWLLEHVLQGPPCAGRGRHARQNDHHVDAGVDPGKRRTVSRVSWWAACR